MREFFILWMERIINVVIVLGAIAVVISGFVAMFSAQGGILQALGVWIIGTIYLILMGGMIYLGLGIYSNTRRTADAVEKMSARS